MATWRQLSDDSLLAAEILLQDGKYRSCVSRAYYAAYCAATHEIVQRLTTFSHGWNNPTHELVPKYIRDNLPIAPAKKNAVITSITLLRYYRVDADYRPRTTIDEQIARDCIRTAAEVQQEFWGTSR